MIQRETFKYLVSLAAVGLVALSLAPLAGHINPTTIALALLLTVLFVATIYGSRKALAASILAVLCFNFFFLPPFYTFQIADTENWIAFAAFVITALVAGQLSTYARRRADEAEAQRVQIEGLYRELQDAFEKASEAEALRRSEKLKSALLDAITHDLRTPLTSIKASVTTILESKTRKLLDEGAETELLEIVNEESDRLNRFIEGIVGLAQIEANALHLRRNWTTIQELINTSIGRARLQLDSYHITIEMVGELPAIFVDAASISEVLYLLLDNSAKYSPKGSRIGITARQTRDGTVEISVADQGKGIPEPLREKIFQKFVRITQSEIPSTEEGLGLGLAIARGIIESQGGRIWVESGTGEFVTRFVFILPIGEPEN
jgi:two-component system sensor histidine kinase KdpD